jgi:hypothetical protein
MGLQKYNLGTLRAALLVPELVAINVLVGSTDMSKVEEEWVGRALIWKVEGKWMQI